MEQSLSTARLLEQHTVRHLVLRLGIPAMFGQFFNILYSIVDRIFVGQIPETGGIALAAIGVCAPALTAITAFAYMVGIGGASAMSISLGQKDPERARAILGNAMLLLLGISAVVTVSLLLFRRPMLYLLGCSDAMFPYAQSYFTIYLCGTVASLCSIGLNQFLLAQGYARQGMVSVVIGAGVNLLLDPLLIFGLDMGVAGAAVATVTAQTCMALYVIFQLRRPNIPIRLGLHSWKSALCRRIVTIGSMSFLITILDNLIIILLNIVLRKYGGAAQGDRLITCATVVQSFLTIVFCPAQGITTGCGTIFSYHYGARNFSKIRQAFAYMFALCALYIGLMQLSVQLFPQVFVGLFLQDSNLYALAVNALRLYTFALIGVAVQYALVDGLTAMGLIHYALPLSVFRKLIYLACILVLPHLLDIQYIFLAGTISDAVGASFSLLLFFSYILPRLRCWDNHVS